MWELSQIRILQMNFSNVGTLANQDFTDELFTRGNSQIEIFCAKSKLGYKFRIL